MSDFDRGKSSKKKFHSQNKDGSGILRGYYGRVPSGSKGEKDSKVENKLTQPILLTREREQTEDVTLSPKRSIKTQEAPTLMVPTTNHENPSAPPLKTMTKSIKFLDDSTLLTENIQEFVQENGDFLVIGIVGMQGVGKSTILNLIAHNTVTEELKNAVFKSNESNAKYEYGENRPASDVNGVKITNSSHTIRKEIFKVQTTEDIENNSNATRGIDLFITSNRVIFLDCQPFLSVSVFDELVQSENKRSNLVSEFIPLENSGEIQGLQMTAFLMSVCHVLIAVQDYFFDSNLIRFLLTAEMLKPTHSNPEDDLNDHFPHLLLIQNKAQMADFSPLNIKTMQCHNLLFSKSRFQKDTNLGLSSSKLKAYFSKNVCNEPFNVFLLPEYKINSGSIYNGHPLLEDLVRKLRANILGTIKTPLAHVPLTEKSWLAYCAKVWENVRKSSFYVEYTKLMP